jgi:chaperonin GroES
MLAEQSRRPLHFEVIMNIKPLGNKIVISRIEGTKQTASGIILRTTEEPDRAEVLAIGPDVNEVSVGDVVLLNWNAAIKTGDYYVITIDHVVFIYGE